MKVDSMNNVVTVAIAKGIKSAAEKAAAKAIEAGSYNVDTLIHVKGSVNKGEDYEQIIHMSVPHWNIIAVLLSKVNGLTMDAVVREALALPDSAVTEIKASAAKAIDTIKASATEVCQGKITTNLTFEEVGIEGSKIQTVQDNTKVKV